MYVGPCQRPGLPHGRETPEAPPPPAAGEGASRILRVPIPHTSATPPELVAPGSLCFVRDVFQVPVTVEMAQLRSRQWAAHRILKVWHSSILVLRRTRL